MVVEVFGGWGVEEYIAVLYATIGAEYAGIKII